MADDQERMLHTDAFSWYMEDDRALRSTVVAVALLDRAPDWDYLKRRVDRMTRLVPLFRRRVQVPPLRLGPPRWVTDPDFDLDFHMRRAVLPAPGGWEGVLEVARVAAMADFDRARPLWEATLLDGLPDGRAALLTKIHHSLSDGIGGVALLGLLVDADREMPPIDELPPPPVGRKVGAARLAAVSAYDDAREALQTAGWAARELRQLPEALAHPREAALATLRMTTSIARIVRPILTQASPVMTQRQMVRRLATLDVPLAEMRRAALANGGHVNDAFLAAVTGGLRRYHQEHDASVDDLVVTMPLSIRKPDDPIGGNRIVLLRFGVPAGLTDPRERIRRIGLLSRQWCREPAIAHTQAIAFGLNLAPRSYIQGVLRKVDFVASDVPGLSEPVCVAGARVEGYYPFGPTIGSALNATLMSYADTCNIGLNIDAGAVPDADLLLRCLRDGFDEVIETAAAVPPQRRRPAARTHVLTG